MIVKITFPGSSCGCDLGAEHTMKVSEREYKILKTLETLFKHYIYIKKEES